MKMKVQDIKLPHASSGHFSEKADIKKYFQKAKPLTIVDLMPESPMITPREEKNPFGVMRERLVTTRYRRLHRFCQRQQAERQPCTRLQT